jgi:hypothetical protein
VATAGSRSGQFAGTIDAQDSSGYTYSITYGFSLGTPTTDISNDAPGYESLIVPATATLTETNTTPGRNAPLYRGFVFGALWPDSSAVNSIYGYTNGGLAECVDATLKTPAGSYCYVSFVTDNTDAQNGPTETELSPGESVDLPINQMGGDTTSSDRLTTASIFEGLPEAKVPSIEALLNSPTVYTLANNNSQLQGSSGEGGANGCAFGEAYHLIGSNDDVLASSAPIRC